MTIQLKESSEEFKKVKTEWEKKVKTMTLENLPFFLQELIEKYSYDYGTVCHAIAISAIATAWAMDRSSIGGITGFQAGGVMWEFIKNWYFTENKTGLRLINYDDFLFPQYANKFKRKIPQSVWTNIKKVAMDEIAQAKNKHKQFKKDLVQYKKDIAAFVKKYPDYYENRKYYDPLGMGTGEEWETERKKEESGFDFAPQKPYNLSPHPNVLAHWKSIIKGEVPFGYTVSDE